MELVFVRRGSTVGVVGAEGWPRSLGSVRGFVLMNHSPTSPSTYDKILPSTGCQNRKYVAQGAAGRHPPRARRRGGRAPVLALSLWGSFLISLFVLSLWFACRNLG